MSDALERVVITTPDAVAPVGHDQKMIDLVDARNAAAAAPPSERPSWLPEKFKTVEDMAASYKELEAKQSGKQTDAAPEAAPVVVPAAAPANPLEVPVVADAAAVVQKAGLDMGALNAEFAASGTLSAESYEKLGAVGFDKAAVDNYVAGQQALVAQFQSDVMSATPGGADKYGEMIEWAKVNMTDAQIATYNTAVSTGNKDQAKLAVMGLGASFTAAVGTEPRLQGGRTAGAQADVFESMAQMKAAMSDPRYKADPAYRSAVASKLGRSSIM